MNLTVGMSVKTKKPHPCGGGVWQVTRTGADVKLQCTSCGREVMMPRPKAP
jgi:hypothetical protein